MKPEKENIQAVTSIRLIPFTAFV